MYHVGPIEIIILGVVFLLLALLIVGIIVAFIVTQKKKKEQSLMGMIQTNKYYALMVLATTLFLLVTYLAACKTAQNVARRARYHAHKQETNVAMALGDEVLKRVMHALKYHVSTNEFEKSFGPLVRLNPEKNTMTHSFYHELSQRYFYLKFEDGLLMHIRSGHSPSDIQTSVIIETPGYLIGEFILKGILLISVVAWVVVFVTGIFSYRFRQSAALTIIPLAALGVLCCLLAPNYNLTFDGIFSNDFLGISVTALIISVCVGFILYKTKKP